MNYEMTVLAALIQTPNPSTREVAEVTGISIRKVQTVLRELSDLFEMKLDRHRDEGTEIITVTDWGVFESGDTLQKNLSRFDLSGIAKHRTKKYSSENSVSSKKKAYDSSKLRNYRASLSLEGINASSREIPTEKAERQRLRQALLKKYSQSNNKAVKHG